MKKHVILACLVLLGMCVTARAQIAPQIQGAGAPANPCANGGQQYVDQTNHVLYGCPNSGGNWVNLGLGNLTGGGGSVTHTAGNLTAFHLMLGNGLADSTVDSACLTNGTGALSGCTSIATTGSISTGSGASACGAGTTSCIAGVEAATACTPTVGQDCLRFDSVTHGPIVSLNGAAETPLGGSAFPLTVTGGVSGGIPYFNSTVQESSSALLAANALVVGGGAGAAPATGSADFTYASHTLTAGAAGLLDLSAAAGLGALKIPSNAAAPPASAIEFNTGFGVFEVTTPGGGIQTFALAGPTGGFINTDCTSTNQVITAVAATAGPTCTSLTPAYLSQVLKAATVITADWTCGTGGTVASCTTAQTIGTLTLTLPLLAKTWNIDCNGVVGQATAATANSWNIQTATNGATNLTASYNMNTAATAMAGGAVTDVASTTTTQVIAPTWTLGGTATKMPFHISATVEGASASGTVVNIQLVAPTVGDLVTIYRGASCQGYSN